MLVMLPKSSGCNTRNKWTSLYFDKGELLKQRTYRLAQLQMDRPNNIFSTAEPADKKKLKWMTHQNNMNARWMVRVFCCLIKIRPQNFGQNYRSCLYPSGGWRNLNSAARRALQNYDVSINSAVSLINSSFCLMADPKLSTHA